MFNPALAQVRKDTLALLADDGKVASHRERLVDHLLEQPRIKKDAQLLNFFARQLEYVYTEIEREEFPDLRAANGEIVPIDRNVPAGAETFTYYVMSGAGVAAFQGSYSHGSAPRVTLKGARVQGKVQRMRNVYGWDIQDVENAQMAGVNLDSELAATARRAHEQLLNDTCFYGAPAQGLPGLFNHPNITVSDAPLNAGSTSTLWINKTPAEIIADVNEVLNGIQTLTLGVEVPNRMLIPRAQYLLISTTRLGAGDGFATILGYLQAAHPGVTFEICNELGTEFSTRNGADLLNNGQRDAIFAYTAGNPRKAALVRPKDFTQLPVQENGFDYDMHCESSTGGVKMPRPLMCHRMDGV